MYECAGLKKMFGWGLKLSYLRALGGWMTGYAFVGWQHFGSSERIVHVQKPTFNRAETARIMFNRRIKS